MTWISRCQCYITSWPSKIGKG